MRWLTTVGVGVRLGVLTGLYNCAFAQDSPNLYHPIPGGVVSLVVGSSEISRPVVKFGSRQVFVTRMRNHWVALLGLSLTSVPGRYIVSIAYNEDDSEIRDFVVKPHRYPVKRYVEQVRRRDATETQELAQLPDRQYKLQQLARLWSDDPLTELPLRIPVDGTPANEYGLRWVKGERMTDPVDHAEFIVPPGSKVRAPGEGVIREIVRINDVGVAVCVDHGMGMLSIVGTMQEAAVAVGDRIDRNTILGLLSPQGAEPVRVTWYVALNRVWVNPMFLVRSR